MKIVGGSKDHTRLSIDKQKLSEEGSESVVIKEAERDADKPFTIEDYNQMFNPIETEDIMNEEQDNPSGLKIAMRKVTAFEVMRVELPLEVIEEINENGMTSEVRLSLTPIFETLSREYVKQCSDKCDKWIDGKLEVQDMEIQSSLEGETSYLGATPEALQFQLYLECPKDSIHIPYDKLIWSNVNFNLDKQRPANFELVKPEVGTMIIYPSWVERETHCFWGKGTRRTLSAKVILK